MFTTTIFVAFYLDTSHKPLLIEYILPVGFTIYLTVAKVVDATYKDRRTKCQQFCLVLGTTWVHGISSNQGRMSWMFVNELASS